MTIAEIAAGTGVSKTTVSMIINNRAQEFHISNSTVKRVREFCSKHNYHPNIHAVRMTRKVAKNIMVMLMSGADESNLSSDVNAAKISSGIIRRATEYGFSVRTALFDRNGDDEKLFDSFRNREIDGMIAYGWSIPREWLTVFQAEKRHVIGIGIAPQPGIGTVNINNFQLSFDLTEKLIASGCRSFFYLCGTPESYPGQERFAGFQAALKAENIYFDPYTMSQTANFSEIQAELTAEKLLNSSHDLPDAIVCANDYMALGVWRAVQRNSADITIAGADNIDTLRFLSPPVSSFSNRPEELGQTAFDLLHRHISGDHSQNDIII